MLSFRLQCVFLNLRRIWAAVMCLYFLEQVHKTDSCPCSTRRQKTRGTTWMQAMYNRMSALSLSKVKNPNRSKKYPDLADCDLSVSYQQQVWAAKTKSSYHVMWLMTCSASWSWPCPRPPLIFILQTNSYPVRCCCHRYAMCVRRWMVPVCLQNAWTPCHRDPCSRMSVKETESCQTWERKTDSGTEKITFRILSSVRTFRVVVQAQKHFYGMQISGSWWRGRPRRTASKHVALVPRFLKHAIHGCLHLAQTTSRWKYKTATSQDGQQRAPGSDVIQADREQRRQKKKKLHYCHISINPFFCTKKKKYVHIQSH